MKSALALTFHGLHNDSGFAKDAYNHEAQRYAVPAGRFLRALERMSPESCCTAFGFLNNKVVGDWLILTFDDGLISDYEIAFPALVEKSIGATFFVTAANIGEPGYLSSMHLREMSRMGMEIGSHGLTHRYLVTMSKSEAIREIKESKEALEQQIGIEVKSFAPVGGHFRGWMLNAAQELGYKVFGSMIPGRTKGESEFLLLHRNHILSGHQNEYLSALLNGDDGRLLMNRFRYYMLLFPKLVLGMDRYDRIRKGLLG